jgi:hypothetical protein
MNVLLAVVDDECTSICRSMHVHPAVVDECTSSVCVRVCLSMNVRPGVKVVDECGVTFTFPLLDGKM